MHRGPAAGLFNNYNRFHEELTTRSTRCASPSRSPFRQGRFWPSGTFPSGPVKVFDVTIAKLVLAIVLFGAAFFLSGRLTAFLGRTLLERFGLDASARTATQQILFYVFMASFICRPLTWSAFPHGVRLPWRALAIGIVSAPRTSSQPHQRVHPVFFKAHQADDTIEMDGLFATVEEIGSRSTRVKTFDNIDVSHAQQLFPEQQDHQLDLTDQKIRL